MKGSDKMIQFKVDSHIIEVDKLLLAKAYVIYYNYNNNELTTKFWYDLEEGKFWGVSPFISKRQRDIIKAKILKIERTA